MQIQDTKKLFPTILLGFLIFLFVYTATDKLIHLDRFVAVLGESPFIRKLNQVLAITIPVLELAIASLLFFDQTRMLALWSSLFLMSAFTIYIGYMLLTVTELPCSCGGVISTFTWKQHFLFNAVVIILIGLLIRNQKIIVATNRSRRKPV